MDAGLGREGLQANKTTAKKHGHLPFYCLVSANLKRVPGNTILNVVFAGVVLAIVELITVVLACAYVAQISRRRKREQMFTRFFFITSYIFNKLRITLDSQK